MAYNIVEIYLHLFNDTRCNHCGNIMFPHLVINKAEKILLYRCSGCNNQKQLPHTGKFDEEAHKKICNMIGHLSEYNKSCWNCNAPISGSDDNLKRDPIRLFGFICPNCGKSLREKLIKKGLIPATFSTFQDYPELNIEDYRDFCNLSHQELYQLNSSAFDFEDVKSSY